MKTTKFKEYSHFKWVKRHYSIHGNNISVPTYHIKLELLRYWLRDFCRILMFTRLKRDKLGNIIN